MRIPRLAPLMLALALAACQRGEPIGSTSKPASPRTSPSPVLTQSPLPAVELEALPAPDEPVPTDPAELAAQLEETTDQLESAIDEWTQNGDPSTGKAPEDVVLLALYQQRMYRYMVGHDRAADRAISRLPKGLSSEARDIVSAGAQLYSLVRGHALKSTTTFKTQRPKPAGVLLGYFKKAESRFGVSWELLAAVNYIESKFGRVKSNSYAGAQGPMQFIPSTWAAYGMGGNVHDPHDAIMGAANYLHANGAPARNSNALYHYNPSWEYVNAVLLYTKRMQKDPRAYYAFYNWQVFVVTTSGDRRLTGPGL